MVITEKHLRKLSKQDLIHMLSDMIGDAELGRIFTQIRHQQVAHGIKCWDCEIIEHKLRGM